MIEYENFKSNLFTIEFVTVQQYLQMLEEVLKAVHKA